MQTFQREACSLRHEQQLPSHLSRMIGVYDKLQAGDILEIIITCIFSALSHLQRTSTPINSPDAQRRLARKMGHTPLCSGRHLCPPLFLCVHPHAARGSRRFQGNRKNPFLQSFLSCVTQGEPGGGGGFPPSSGLSGLFFFFFLSQIPVGFIG